MAKQPQRRVITAQGLWLRWGLATFLMVACWGFYSRRAGHYLFFWPIIPSVLLAVVVVFLIRRLPPSK